MDFRGATHHVCCCSSLFTHLTPIHNAYITLPNSHKVHILSTGSIILTPTLTPTSVLFVPAFNYNLISISALTSSTSYQVSFTHTDCVIQDVSKEQHIGMGRRFGNFYILDPSFSCNLSSSCNSAVTANTWHYRLGHPSLDKLKLLSSPLSLKNFEHDVCYICPLAKQRHNPFILLPAMHLLFLILFTVLFGGHLLLLVLMVTYTFLPLLMITLDLSGPICLKQIQMSVLYSLIFSLKSTLSLIKSLKPLDVTMELSSIYLICLINLEP